MRIVYCCPGLGACGGIRVIVEHANRLARLGHEVILATPHEMPAPQWITVEVPIRPYTTLVNTSFDIVVATGYETVQMATRLRGTRARAWFLQMKEEQFFAESDPQYTAARDSYLYALRHGFRVITIADWLVRYLREEYGIEAHHIPNGINFEHFYPDGDKMPCVLVEGDYRNMAKDILCISWRVALELRARYGLKVWAYAATSNKYSRQLDCYMTTPTTTMMRRAYSVAAFLLKASRYEGRALAPLEAMACGTTCARAIIHGDDDLVDQENCLRVPYDYDALLEAASRLCEDKALRERLSASALKYAKEHLDWDPIISRLEGIYASLA